MTYINVKNSESEKCGNVEVGKFYQRISWFCYYLYLINSSEHKRYYYNTKKLMSINRYGLQDIKHGRACLGAIINQKREKE